MIARDSVNGWLKEISLAAGLNAGLNDSGICGLKYKDTVDVFLEVPPTGVNMYLYSPVLRLDSDPKSDARRLLYEELLKANFLCQETKGATLSFDAQENTIVLCLNQSVEYLDELSFKNLFGNFLELALEWKKRLSDASFSQQDGPAATGLSIPVNERMMV
ncbi:MAG: CesT family type III secretion system chaperone [Nitrospirae bacterium]|nr:CesT family type III secretion system chaperone [Nitrospirota bacterium]